MCIRDSINTFSTKTGIDINYIRVFMRDRLLQSKLWDKERQEEMLQALFQKNRDISTIFFMITTFLSIKAGNNIFLLFYYYHFQM